MVMLSRAARAVCHPGTAWLGARAFYRRDGAATRSEGRCGSQAANAHPFGWSAPDTGGPELFRVGVRVGLQESFQASKRLWKI